MQRYGDPMRQRTSFVVAAGDGVFVAGTFEGVIDLGAGPLAAAGDEDGFVAHLGF